MNPGPGRPRRPKVDTLGLSTAAQLQSSTRMRHSSLSPMSPSSRAWYGFNLTGGDHIKNLLIVLLIFYLHQIIESTSLSSPLLLPTLTDSHTPYKVPWDLYQKSRPRRRSPSLPPPPPSADSPETTYRTYATSELRSFELSLLFLTFLPLPRRSLIAIRNSRRPRSSIRLVVQHGPLRTM